MDPIQATGFEEYQHNDDWERAGFEEPDENFDVEWTHANYELPHVSAGCYYYLCDVLPVISLHKCQVFFLSAVRPSSSFDNTLYSSCN